MRMLETYEQDFARTLGYTVTLLVFTRSFLTVLCFRLFVKKEHTDSSTIVLIEHPHSASR